MGIFTACLETAVEAWPAVKAGFQGLIEAPWEEKLAIGKDYAGKVDKATQWFQTILAPDVFYKSTEGQAIASSALIADQTTKLRVAKEFLDSNKDFLPMVDPIWERKGGEVPFDQGAADSFTDYLKGSIGTSQIPPAIQNQMAKAKQYIVDQYNAAPNLRRLSPNWDTDNPLWTLEDDVISPTIKEFFNPENPALQAGLLKVVPKQTAIKFLEEGKAADVSGVDWLKAAVPIATRKREFDPVIEQMRAAMPGMSGLERDYTESMIDRITGKPTTIQKKVDNMVNSVRMVFGAPEAKISPSAQFAAGVTRQFYKGILLYNPGMALLNLTQTINTASKYGLAETLGGLKNFASTEGRSLAAERQFLGDFDKWFYQRAPENAWQKGMQKFEHVGYKMFDKAENFNRGLAFHTGLNEFIRDNSLKSLEDFLALRTGSAAQKELFSSGMLHGINAANETQFLYGVVNQSPYLTSPLAKMAGGQFLTFPLRQSEFLMKETRRQGWAFPARYIAYTGAASATAYYGMNLAIGQQLGGAGGIPEAVDLFQQGKTSDAIWAASGSLFKFLPDTPQFTPFGITPFGTTLFNVLNLMSSEDPETKWAKVGNSFMSTLPAGVEIRRVATAALTQLNQGNRISPKGGVESLAFLTLLSAAAQRVFGEPIPGIEPYYTGKLQRKQDVSEISLAGLGLRSREAEMESRILDINRDESQEARQGSQDFGSQIALAMLHGKPDDVMTAMSQAMQSGLFVSQQHLYDSIEAGMRGQLLTRLQREQRSAPKSVQIKRLGQ